MPHGRGRGGAGGARGGLRVQDREDTKNVLAAEVAIAREMLKMQCRGIERYVPDDREP